MVASLWGQTTCPAERNVGSCPRDKWPVPGFRQQKRQPGGCLFARIGARLFGGLGRALAGVALLELVDASGGIHDLLLAGVERVRLRGNLDLVDRIFLAVLPLDGLVGRDRRAGDESEIAAGVEENDLAVIGVDAVFHGFRLVGGALELKNWSRQRTRNEPARARESTIIREKMNESKGLLQTLVGVQTLERTGFFGPNPARRFRAARPG